MALLAHSFHCKAFTFFFLGAKTFPFDSANALDFKDQKSWCLQWLSTKSSLLRNEYEKKTTGFIVNVDILMEIPRSRVNIFICFFPSNIFYIYVYSIVIQFCWEIHKNFHNNLTQFFSPCFSIIFLYHRTDKSLNIQRK